jgi:uncharacterized Zn finger protein (UPF0148 family)
MSYELKETESYWCDPLGDKTLEVHCNNCKSDAFQIFFEGDVIYFICDNCCQIFEPIEIKK